MCENCLLGYTQDECLCECMELRLLDRKSTFVGGKAVIKEILYCPYCEHLIYNWQF